MISRPWAFLYGRQKEILETAGARQAWVDPADLGEVTYSRHLMGTFRMGDDPKTSLVDRWNRTHDVRDQFLVDGSSLVTCAQQQPTTTIQALAYWAADYIQKAASRGEI
jgi:choline dehydrogenase-like flavoprotein